MVDAIRFEDVGCGGPGVGNNITLGGVFGYGVKKSKLNFHTLE